MPLLIVVFDGLRPDAVAPGSMPALSAFLRDALVFSRASTVFPSETRVAAATVATGCYPETHGMVGNAIYVPAIEPASLLNTGDAAVMDRMESVLGKVLDTPSLGEILARHGKSLAVASGGSTGSCRLLHHKASALGAYRYSLHGASFCAAPEQFAHAESALGTVPAVSCPSRDRNAYLARVFITQVLPLRPEVALLWFTDPDYTGHYRGLRAPAHAGALRSVDENFAHILRALAEEEKKGKAPWNILTASDHGQIPLCGGVDPRESILGPEGRRLRDRLAQAGFGLNIEDRGKQPVVLVKPGRCAEFFVSGGEQEAAGEILSAFFAEQDWVGALIENTEKPSPFSLPSSLPRAGHPAAPLLRLTPISVPGPGGTRAALDGPNSVFASHGGLEREETRILLALRGSGIEPGVSGAACGLVDIAPSALALTGVPVPEHMHGQPLPHCPDKEGVKETLHAVPCRPDLALRLRFRGGRSYPDCLVHGEGGAQ
ncbi:hypothetical protein FACS1894206_02620 [Deltaproteobacteria bacterium]|nr:hypothetical protein FACS1894206_02620 [Deltaproteobacteria bacterium]